MSESYISYPLDDKGAKQEPSLTLTRQANRDPCSITAQGAIRGTIPTPREMDLSLVGSDALTRAVIIAPSPKVEPVSHGYLDEGVELGSLPSSNELNMSLVGSECPHRSSDNSSPTLVKLTPRSVLQQST